MTETFIAAVGLLRIRPGVSHRGVAFPGPPLTPAFGSPG
jgi:hypothetical protein